MTKAKIVPIEKKPPPPPPVAKLICTTTWWCTVCSWQHSESTYLNNYGYVNYNQFNTMMVIRGHLASHTTTTSFSTLGTAHSHNVNPPAQIMSMISYQDV